MATKHSAGRRGFSRRLVYGVATALIVTAAAIAAVTTAGGTPDTRGAVATQDAERSGVEAPLVAAQSGRRAGAVIPERPLRAVLPSGSTVSIRAVSTTDDGTLDVPDDVNVAGWWRGGSRIGDPFGSMLLAAHVDSTTQGLGPYAELLTVEPGQSIELTSKHLRQKYTVRSLRLVGQGPLTDHPEIYSASGPHRLTLVTCAGPFVPSKGGYQKLAVVTATVDGHRVPTES